MTLHDHCFVQCHFVYVTMNGKNGCAILAGGAGSRMGNINKAILEYGGNTFAGTIMSKMTGTGMPCYLSIARYEQGYPKGWTPVMDVLTNGSGDFIGPMGGIYSCLIRAREDGLQGLFFAPCDAPFYSAEAVDKLAEYIGPDVDAVIWRTADGRLQMTFAYYSVSLIPILETLVNEGRYSLKACLDKANIRIVESDDTDIDEKLFVNINDLEDYNKLKETEKWNMII